MTGLERFVAQRSLRRGTGGHCLYCDGSCIRLLWKVLLREEQLSILEADIYYFAVYVNVWLVSIKIYIGHTKLFLENNLILRGKYFKDFSFSQLGICNPGMYYSKRDLDYMIQKRNKPNLTLNSQIYIFEKKITNSWDRLCSSNKKYKSPP
jgi:hypothetical protein